MSPMQENLTSIESIEKSLSKTRINITILSIPFDIWLPICSYLEDVRTVIALERSCKTIFNILSRKNGDFIWRNQSDKEGLSRTEGSAKSSLLCYLQTKLEWMTFPYSSNYEYACHEDEEGVRGVSSLFLTKQQIDSTQPLQFYSSSWTGYLAKWKVAMVHKKINDTSIPALDSSLFNSWFLSPPQTPRYNPETDECSAISPPRVKGIKSISSTFMNCQIKVSSQYNENVALGLSDRVILLNPTSNDLYRQKTLFRSSATIISCLVLSADYCVGTFQNQIICWSINGNHNDSPPLRYALSRESIKFLSFLGDDSSTLMLAMHLNGDICVFDLLTGTQIQQIRSIGGLTSGFLLNQGRKSWKIWAGYRDGNIRSWTLKQTCDSSFTVSAPHPLQCSLGDHITCLAVYENLVIAGNWDGMVRIFDSKTSSRRTLSMPENRSPVLSVLHLPNTTTVVSGHYNGTITVWDFTHLNPKSKKSPTDILPQLPSKRLKQNV